MAAQTRSRSGTVPAPRASAGAGRYPARPAGSTRPRTGGRTQQSQGPRFSGAIERQRNAPIGPSNRYYELRDQQQRPARTPARSTPARPAAAPAPARRRRVRYEQPERIRRASAPSGNYQPVILAEFVGVILAIAMAPVAKGESQSGVSPYGGGDMVKLAAATLLFVLLGFVSTASQGAARIAAWFGGLTLIAVGLAEGAAVSKEIGLFTGNLAAAAQGQPSGGSPLSQGEAQAAYLQGLGAQEAATYGQGPFGQIGQAIVNAFGKIGPQGVPESLTGQGKPL